MRNIRLSARLKAVANLLPKCECIVDVGCDHGQLGLYLLQTDHCQRLIASDISEPSLQKAERLFLEHGVEDRVQTIRQDGLPLKGKAQAAIIAGIGGSTTISIVEHGFDAAKEMEALVLQPADDAAELRSYLWANGFLITKEAIVSEERFFPIIAVRYDGKKRPALDDAACELGPINMLKPDQTLLRYTDWRIRIWEKALRIQASDEAGRTNQQKIRRRLEAIKAWREENANEADLGANQCDA